MTHYYPHVNAGVVHVEVGELRVGDTIHVRGHTTDYYQRVDRLELDHQPVEVARVGQSVGIARLAAGARGGRGDEGVRGLAG